jgi:hypothetical protein
MKQLYRKQFSATSDYQSWRVIQFGGHPQKEYSCSCSICMSGGDCCGQTVCWYVRSWLWGFVTVGYYSINV